MVGRRNVRAFRDRGRCGGVRVDWTDLLSAILDHRRAWDRGVRLIVQVDRIDHRDFDAFLAARLNEARLFSH